MATLGTIAFKFEVDLAQSITDFSNKLVKSLLHNLRIIGFNIEPENEVEFIENRVSRITKEDNIVEFYLDYVDESNQGIFVGAYQYFFQAKFIRGSYICDFYFKELT